MRDGLARLDFEPELILASFHGTPQDQFVRGDPYYRHCVETARLLREALGLPPEKFILTFQSRFGRAEWLKPYTDETVKQLARSGVRRLAIVTPGFAADCLETIEEIGVENAHYFHDNGGEKFAHIPCLNDSEGGLSARGDRPARARRLGVKVGTAAKSSAAVMAGHTFSQPDLIIAATAPHHGLTIVTRDVSDYQRARRCSTRG